MARQQPRNKLQLGNASLGERALLMMRLIALAAVLLAAGCAGSREHVFPPDASLQQLAATDDGWQLAVRLHNYSFETILEFERIEATLTVDGEPAGHFDSELDLAIPGLSADVAHLDLQPNAAGVAALADGKPIAYHLEGTIVATPEEGSRSSYEFARDGWLSPVPGRPGTWR